ncbi:MAG: 2-oxoacid:acceptor oxidoreductase family protein [Bryobacteraceae bacterium]|nr:2-oxoacid:acceptor oxidoreductase family protein [Bryobacteraceae bacterium]
MRLTEIRIAGFGGQGVILATQILGKAASIFDGLHATMTQSFGPEARGGACSAQLIVSDEPVLYPYVTQADVLVAMSQEAYSRFAREGKPGGILIVERDLVEVGQVPEGVRVYPLAATGIAEKLGKRVVQNVVMLGFLNAIAGIVSAEALEKAVLSSVPGHLAELNQRALQAGAHAGENILSESAVPIATPSVWLPPPPAP